MNFEYSRTILSYEYRKLHSSNAINEKNGKIDFALTEKIKDIEAALEQLNQPAAGTEENDIDKALKILKSNHIVKHQCTNDKLILQVLL